MKKLLFPLFILLALSLVLVSCESEVEEPKYYTVTFKDGDNVIEVVSVKEGDNCAKIQDPEKEGYVLLHWYLVGESASIAFDFENTPINADITLIAEWGGAAYTVTFDSDDNYPAQLVKPGEKATKPGPSSVTWGYYKTTSGGTQTVEVFNFNTVINKDITLFKCYKVDYKDKNGSIAITGYVKSGEKVTEPSSSGIIHTGYSFEGWYQDSETTIPFDFDTPITQDTVIYSKWEAK